MTNATAWVLNVAATPWYQVNMAMKDCLTRNLARVDSDIEPINCGINVL